MDINRRPPSKVWSSLCIGFIESFTFGALHFGWPNLAFIYSSEGLFSQLCPRNETNHTESMEEVYCPEMDNMLNLAFTIAVGLNAVLFFAVGMLFDKYGLWATRIFASLIFLPGILMLAFAQAGWSSYLIFPGLLCVSVGGTHIVVTVIHITLQAGTRMSTWSGLYSGAIDASTAIFFIVMVLYEQYGISQRDSLCFIAGMWIFVIISTFGLLPRFKVSSPDVKIKASKPEKAHVETKPESFMSCMKNPLYWLLIWWFSMIQLRLVYYLGSINTWLSYYKTDDQVSHFLMVLGYIGLGSMLVAPLPGLITDFYVQKEQDQEFNGGPSHVGWAKTMAPSLWIGTCLAILHSCLAMFHSDALVYLTFVALIFMRGFLFGTLYIYITRVFPMDLFGKCVGFCFLCAGLVSYLQYALFTWVNNTQDFQLVNGIVLGLTITTLMLPVFIELSYCRLKSNHDTQLTHF